MEFKLSALQMKSFEAIEALLVCGVCGKMLHDPYSTGCEHHFCKQCIKDALEDSSECPECKLPCRPGELVRNATFARIVKSVSRLRRATELLEETRALKHSGKKFKVDDVLNFETERSDQNDERSREFPEKADDDAGAVDSTDMKWLKELKKKDVDTPARNIENLKAKYASSQLNREEESPVHLKVPVVMQSGLKSEKKFAEWVNTHGAKFFTKFHEELPIVTHLVIDGVFYDQKNDKYKLIKRSPKFLYALFCDAEIVSADWIEACYEADEFVPIGKYTLRNRCKQIDTVKDMIEKKTPDITNLEKFNYIVMEEQSGWIHIIERWFKTMGYDEVEVKDMVYLQEYLGKEASSVKDLVKEEDLGMASRFKDQSKSIFMLCDKHLHAEGDDGRDCSLCANERLLVGQFENAAIIPSLKFVGAVIRNEAVQDKLNNKGPLTHGPKFKERG